MSPSASAAHVERVSWLGRPAGWGWVAAVAALTLAAPLWLWLDPFDGYSLQREGLAGALGRLAVLGDPFEKGWLLLDDFDYVAKSRTSADLSRHLLTPHNTHLVPLFRAWTFGWVQAAGTLERLPGVLGMAGYATYVLAMLLVGHVVAWETGRPALGLGVMAGFGVSAVLEPTARWFAASQALLAGVAVLACLAALQRWRAVGGWWWVALGTIAGASAPLIWSGGYVAGPVAAAYLWTDGRRRARLAGVGVMAMLAFGVVGSLLVAGREITAAGNFHDHAFTQAVNPVQGVMSTLQAVVEILWLRNLGLQATTTPAQASVLLAMLALAWAWWRGGPWRTNALESAGVATALLGFVIVYTVRGYYTFDNLRDLSWYQAIPQLGGALFAGGLLMGRAREGGDGPTPRRLNHPSRGGLIAVLGVVLGAIILQAPLVRARLVATAAPMSPTERERFLIPPLQRLRARYLEGEKAAWQRRFLARLDRAEALARLQGLGRETLSRHLGHVVGPGMPSDIPHIDAVNLLALPATGADVESMDSFARIGRMLAPEPEPRPPWLAPGEPWPPAAR